MSKPAYFEGTADTQKTAAWERLPYIDPKALNDPKDYIAAPGLSAAVNVALTLGMPLLLTGEPGCGKSQLANRVAWELGFHRDDPLKFVVKSNAEARDLFYSFDTVGRFHAAQTRKEDAAAVNFIDYQPLGLALLYAKDRDRLPKAALSAGFLERLRRQPPRRSVVLLDEIDKAPRDVPNDILAEIEEMRFRIPELGGAEVSLESEEEQHRRPVVVITSNSERDLPDAFLRRCVYYHVPFPPFRADLPEGDEPPPVTVETIVQRRLGARYAGHDKFLAGALSLFKHIRAEADRLNKPPSIAELLNWLDCLEKSQRLQGAGSDVNTGVFPENLAGMDPATLLLSVKTTLLKTREDQAQAAELVNAWREPEAKASRAG